MPDLRYALRNGDPTSTGGILIVSKHHFSHHGVLVGLEGDTATCPACKSVGPVFNDCDPSFDIGGRQILVNGARVHCRCAKKPMVIHTQYDFTIEVNRSGHGATATEASSYANTPADDEEVLEQYLEIVNLETGEGIRNLRYDLYVNGVSVTCDRPMNNGRTQAVQGSYELAATLWHDWREA